MKMREPYLGIYVSDGALHFSKKLPSEDCSRDIFVIDLTEIVEDEADAAAAKLGGTVLGILRLWHQAEFSAWGELRQSRDNNSRSTFETAMYLIDRFSKGCSEDRLALIDELLREAALTDLRAEEFVGENWPVLRSRLLEKFVKEGRNP